MATRELPIFPLPLVLFPGIAQAFHIFEPRYRAMLAACLAADRRFGVSFVPDQAGDPSPEPGSIGCVAVIRSTTPLADGRSNIVTAGEQRFVLRDYVERGHPYRMGLVEPVDDDAFDPADGAAAAGQLRTTFARFAAAVAQLNDEPPRDRELPTEATALSFYVAAALDVELRWKQELLALRSTPERLRRLERLLQSINADLSAKVALHTRARRNGKGDGHPTLVREP